MKWRWLVILAFMGGSLWWVAQNLDWEHLLANLSTAQWEWLIPSTLLGMVTYAVLAYRWKRILHNRPSFPDTFSAFMVGVYANTLLPLRVGDVTRSYLIHQRVPELAVLMVLTSIGTGLMLDMLSMVLILPPSLLVFPIPKAVAAGSLVIAGITFTVGVLFFNLARNDALTEKMKPFISRWLAEQWEMRFWAGWEHLKNGVSILRDNVELARLILLTLLAYGIQGMANWFLLLALQPDLSLAAGYVVMIGAALGFAVPLLPGSVGTYEAAITLTLTSVGLTPENAVLASLLFRAQYNATIIFMGSLASLREGIGLGDLRQTAVHNSDGLD